MSASVACAGNSIKDDDSIDEHIDNGDIDDVSKLSTSEREIRTREALIAERQWYQKLGVEKNFNELERLLRLICRRVYIHNKLDVSVNLECPPPPTQRFNLVQRRGAEILRCNMTMVGECVIHVEVFFKYPKMPGGVYRATAQPDVHWKLHQLQDMHNYCVQALTMIVKAKNWLIQAKSSSQPLKTNSTIMNIIAEISNLMGQVRSTLCIPRRRTLLELCNLPITKCFNPALPPDLVFSFYINANRLVCAAYQVTPKGNDQGLTVTHADCVHPAIVDALHLVDSVIDCAHNFSCNLAMFEDHINVRSFYKSNTIIKRF